MKLNLKFINKLPKGKGSTNYFRLSKKIIKQNT